MHLFIPSSTIRWLLFFCVLCVLRSQLHVIFALRSAFGVDSNLCDQLLEKFLDLDAASSKTLSHHLYQSAL